MQELLEIYHRNFPNNVRSEIIVKEILGNKDNHVIEERINGKLVGVSLINKSTILMLCVDEEYRKKGIGTRLLNKSERYILDQGYDKVNIGEGFDYLMPGVPINEENISFFERRFYIHSWGNDECFDMDMDLKDTICDYNLGDTVDGITYRLATIDDLDEIRKCTDDAYQEFTEYYMNTKLYDLNNDQIVLVAVDKDEICGTLLISKETAINKYIILYIIDSTTRYINVPKAKIITKPSIVKSKNLSTFVLLNTLSYKVLLYRPSSRLLYDDTDMLLIIFLNCFNYIFLL